MKKVFLTTCAFILSSGIAMAAEKVKVGATVELGTLKSLVPNTCNSRKPVVTVPHGADLGKIHYDIVQQKIGPSGKEYHNGCVGKMATHVKISYRAGQKAGTDRVTVYVKFPTQNLIKKYYTVNISSNFDG